MKVDTVYIQRNTGSDVDAFNINSIADARREAANLSAYHGEEFRLVIRNEKRAPAKEKSVKLDKRAKFWNDRIKVFHECAVTKKLEKINV